MSQFLQLCFCLLYFVFSACSSNGSSSSFAVSGGGSPSTNPTMIPYSQMGNIAELTFDVQGNLYILTGNTGDSVAIFPNAPNDGKPIQILGSSFWGGSINQLSAAGSLVNPQSMVVDTSGNLYVGTYDSSTKDGNVYVIPVSTGSIFGVSVTANTATPLLSLTSNSLANPIDLAVDPSGNLYVNQDNAHISVLSSKSGSLFGTTVVANQITQLNSLQLNGQQVDNIAFDSQGNFYFAVAGSIFVMPITSGTLFNQSVTANQLSPVVYTGKVLKNALQMVFGPGDDLYIRNYSNDAGTFNLLVLYQATGELALLPSSSMLGMTSFALQPGASNSYNFYTVATQSADSSPGIWQLTEPNPAFCSSNCNYPNQTCDKCTTSCTCLSTASCTDNCTSFKAACSQCNHSCVCVSTPSTTSCVQNCGSPAACAASGTGYITCLGYCWPPADASICSNQ